MKRLSALLAFIGPVMQFVAAFMTSSAVNYDRPNTNDSIPVPLYLEPGGLAFAIWPVIFIAFVLLGIYQLKPSRLDDSRFVKGRPFIFLAGLGNTIWFYGDVNSILSICTIGFIIMLVSLAKLNNIFFLGEKSVSIHERWFIKFPISLFFGWITVAFPIGITLWLITDFGLTGESFLGPEAWSALIIVVAFGVFATLYWLEKVSIVFLIAGIWGLSWIFVANINDKMILAMLAALAAVFLFAELIIVRFNLKKPILQS